MTEAADDRDARTLLPWYATGTLGDADRARVERLLAGSGAARAELDWLRAVAEDMKRTLDVPAGDLGRGRLMQRIAVERAPDKVIALPARRERPRWAMPAFALAAAVLIAQAVVIGVLVHERGATFEPLGGAVPAPGELLQVTFRPDAPERDIRAALAAIEGDIVGGPGALGVYTVRVGPGRADAAAKALAARADLVESVSVARR